MEFKQHQLCTITSGEYKGKVVVLIFKLVYGYWECYFKDNPSEYITLHENEIV